MKVLQMQDKISGTYFNFSPEIFQNVSEKRTGRLIKFTLSANTCVFVSPVDMFESDLKVYVLHDLIRGRPNSPRTYTKRNTRSISKDIAYELMDVDQVPEEDHDLVERPVEPDLIMQVRDKKKEKKCQ